MVKSKGLGDTIEKITKATGIKTVVDKISDLTGVDCGCEERKQKLNAIFPYSKVRQFTNDEKQIYETIIARTKGTITGQDQANLVKLYNKVFKANKVVSNCGSCIKQTMAQLDKVYKNSC